MSKKQVVDFFAGLDACQDGRDWAKTCTNLKQVWDTCKRSDWMLWALNRIGFNDERKLRLYACACARKTPLADGRTVWDLLTDERSRRAVEVAELYAEGKATDAARDAARAAATDAATDAAWAATRAARDAANDVAWDAARDAARAARDAAWEAAWEATWAAAWAAAHAAEVARAAARDAQSQLLREWISWEEVEAAIKKYLEATK